MARTFEERFWARVDKTDGCWLWTAARNRQGYGVFHRADNSTVLAHRLVLELTLGGVAPGLHAHHRCETPLCVNPAHLELRTPTEHAQHHNPRWTHCKHGHEFTPENAHVRANGTRYCRVCDAERTRRRREDPAFREPERAAQCDYLRRKREAVAA